MTTIESYLAQLDALLDDVDPTIREGLVGGIREELAGLSDADAVQRLRALGDPAFVAASARAELPKPIEASRHDAAWYSVVTVLMLTVGGYAIPVLGWIVGLVLLWASKTWTGSQKTLGTLLPILATVFFAAVFLPIYDNEYAIPYPNWPAILLVATMIAWVVTAIWLLIVAARARRR
jgi:hypothetical protein